MIKKMDEAEFQQRIQASNWERETNPLVELQNTLAQSLNEIYPRAKPCKFSKPD